MILSQEQLDRIEQYLQVEQLRNKSLESDLLDHYCCLIEQLVQDESLSFEQAFEEAKSRISPDGIREFEIDLNHLTTHKPTVIMKKLVYISGYFTAFFMVVGISLIGFSQLKKSSIEFKTQIRVVDYENKLLNNESVERDYTAEQRAAVAERYLTLRTASRMINTGQFLIAAAVFLFCLVQLPYIFYTRYQRSTLEYMTN